jgi:hypothetical protein
VKCLFDEDNVETEPSGDDNDLTALVGNLNVPEIFRTLSRRPIKVAKLISLKNEKAVPLH